MGSQPNYFHVVILVVKVVDQKHLGLKNYWVKKNCVEKNQGPKSLVKIRSPGHSLSWTNVTETVGICWSQKLTFEV